MKSVLLFAASLLLLGSCRNSLAPEVSRVDPGLNSELRAMLDEDLGRPRTPLPAFQAVVIGRSLWITGRLSGGGPIEAVDVWMDTDQVKNTGYVPGRGYERLARLDAAGRLKVVELDGDDFPTTGYGTARTNGRRFAVCIPLRALSDDGIIDGLFGISNGEAGVGGEFTSHRIGRGEVLASVE